MTFTCPEYKLVYITKIVLQIHSTYASERFTLPNHLFDVLVSVSYFCSGTSKYKCMNHLQHIPINKGLRNIFSITLTDYDRNDLKQVFYKENSSRHDQALKALTQTQSSFLKGRILQQSFDV